MHTKDKAILNILHQVERQCDSLSKQKDTIIIILKETNKVNAIIIKLDSMYKLQLYVKVFNLETKVGDLTKVNKRLKFWNEFFKITTVISTAILLAKLL